VINLDDEQQFLRKRPRGTLTPVRINYGGVVEKQGL
jgi:hypothetical protein